MPDHPQESLAQAAAAIFQRQLVAFLVIWLAIGFPVTCQVHGMMSMYELEPHIHDGIETSTEYPCAIHEHDTAPSMTMLLSLVTSLVPDQVACHDVFLARTVSGSVILWPLQVTSQPPEEPPRLS